MLNFNTLEATHTRIDFKDYVFVLIHSLLQHKHAGSSYNERRRLCERIATKLGVDSLGRLGKRGLYAQRSKLSPDEFRKARFVVMENERVWMAFRALKTYNIATLGALLYASHSGLQHECQVSCKEIDFLVTAARRSRVVIGARIMGGGFGGCTLNLVRKNALHKLEEVAQAYKNKFSLTPDIIPVKIGGGARIIKNMGKEPRRTNSDCVKEEIWYSFFMARTQKHYSYFRDLLCKRLLLLVAKVGSFASPALGQENTNWFSQTELAVRWNTEKTYTPSVSLAHRRAYDVSTNRGKFVELGHLSEIAIIPQQKKGVGVLYRFAAPFYSASKEEWRLVQQFTTSQPHHGLRVGHRLRAEERFFSNHTRFRLRYRLGFTPVEAHNRFYMLGNGEELGSVSAKATPTYELRLGLGVGKWWRDSTNIQAVFEYRLKKTPSNLFFYLKTHLEL